MTQRTLLLDGEHSSESLIFSRFPGVETVPVSIFELSKAYGVI